MIGTYFIIIAVIIGLAFLGLGISTFFGKKKKFPDTHIGKNKAMKNEASVVLPRQIAWKEQIINRLK